MIEKYVTIDEKYIPKEGGEKGLSSKSPLFTTKQKGKQNPRPNTTNKDTEKQK